MKNTSQKFITNHLRKHRLVRGLKQRQVAKILGIKSTSMISRWENGSCLPNSHNIFRLAVLYRTMVDALFIDFLISLKNELSQKEELVLGRKDEKP